MRGKGKNKNVNDNRDIGGRNKVENTMEIISKLEIEYENAINDKPGYENDRANDLLVEAIKHLNTLVSEL